MRGTPAWQGSKCRNNRSKRQLSVDIEGSDPEDGAGNKESVGESDCEVYMNNNISARHVSAVISSFDDIKRQHVKEIGFGGLLDLPEIDDVDKNFSLWLFKKVRWWTRQFLFDDESSVMMLPQHMELSFGIPSSGKEVSSSVFKNLDQKLDFIQKVFGQDVDETERMDVAEDIVKQPIRADATKEQVDKFKIAFVLFVVSRLLAPNKKNKYGNSDIWAAISDPDKIGQYNWGSYVMTNLFETARLLQWDSAEKKDISKYSSCGFALQVFYLDNLDLGEMSLPHNVFPRVKCFDYRTVRSMILSDTQPMKNNNQKPEYGACKVRRKVESCYLSSEFVVNPNVEQRSAEPSGLKPKTKRTKFPVVDNVSIDNARPYVAASSNSSNTSTNATLVGQFPNLQPQSIPDFSAFIRNKYNDKVDGKLLNFLKIHNAKCLQHATRLKNELASAIVQENMVLADRFMEHFLKNNESVGGLDKQGNTTGVNNGTPQNVIAVSDNKFSNNYATPVRESVKNLPLNQIVGMSQAKVISPGIPKSSNSKAKLVNQKSKSSLNKLDRGTGLHMCEKSVTAEDKSIATPAPSTKFGPISPVASPTKDIMIFSEAAVAARIFSSLDDINLNARALDAEYSVSPVDKRSAKIGRFAQSPWALELTYPEREINVTQSLFKWLCSCNGHELNRCWIMHDIPRYIELTGGDLKDQFTAGALMSYEVFDIIIRRMRQIETTMHVKVPTLRWRHLLESDFAMNALGNATVADNLSIREQFVGSIVPYEIARCQMIVVPVRVRNYWWCYFWDMKLREIFILDPSAGSTSDNIIISKHKGTIDRLHNTIKDTVNNLFTGWHQVWDEWGRSVVSVSKDPCSSAESGFYTLYCVKNFNGIKLDGEPTKVVVDEFKEYILYELMGINGNRGKQPGVYIQTIED